MAEPAGLRKARLKGRFKQWYNQWYDRKVVGRNLLGQVLRKARRFYFGTFRAEYVREAIAKNRQGECNRCGACCELIYKCPFLGRDSQNLPFCRVYGDLRPASCHVYPFDAIDSEVDECSYTFKKPAP
ncbi:MAG: hypothetical protein NDJ89_01680 [Oligoflexia bacterium]|nr:hypothetical protein [Oligoflexia bacterium]